MNKLAYSLGEKIASGVTYGQLWESVLKRIMQYPDMSQVLKTLNAKGLRSVSKALSGGKKNKVLEALQEIKANPHYLPPRKKLKKHTERMPEVLNLMQGNKNFRDFMASFDAYTPTNPLSRILPKFKGLELVSSKIPKIPIKKRAA